MCGATRRKTSLCTAHSSRTSPVRCPAMPVYRLGDAVPSIDPTAYVSPEAVIIGDVVLGPEASVWPCAVLRGDTGTIRIGARTSIQDGAVLHTTREHPTVVGDDCTIGHLAH